MPDARAPRMKLREALSGAGTFGRNDALRPRGNAAWSAA
jgi:hypothetical protein